MVFFDCFNKLQTNVVFPANDGATTTIRNGCCRGSILKYLSSSSTTSTCFECTNFWCLSKLSFLDRSLSQMEQRYDIIDGHIWNEDFLELSLILCHRVREGGREGGRE